MTPNYQQFHEEQEWFLHLSGIILVKNYVILHVCGKGKRVDCDIKGYHQFEFIKDMGMAYACADFVVSRSGSNTLFEILSLKKPAVLIPLEGATRGDQLQNAQYFERKGVCRILRQSDLALLPKALDLLSQDNELLKRLNNLSLPIANERILKKIREFLS